MDVLPKGRTVDIRGDVVKTRRMAGGWPTAGEFAVAIHMSEDRVIEIERGGERVFQKNLMKIAEVLDIPWQELVVDPKKALNPNPKKEFKHYRDADFVPGALKFGNLSLSDIEDLDSWCNQLLRDLVRSIGVKGHIIVIAVQEGSIMVEILLNKVDVLRFLYAFVDHKLEWLGITAIRLPVLVLTADIVVQTPGLLESNSCVHGWITLDHHLIPRIKEIRSRASGENSMVGDDV